MQLIGLATMVYEPLGIYTIKFKLENSNNKKG